MLRSPPATKAGQTVAYLLLAFAGATALMWPIPIVESTAGSRVMAGIWVSFLIVGGLTAAVGRALGQWPWEFVGLPPVGAAVAIYGLSVLYTTVRADAFASVPAGIVIVAVCGLVTARWAEVNRIREEALRLAKRDRGDILIGRHREDGGR